MAVPGIKVTVVGIEKLQTRLRRMMKQYSTGGQVAVIVGFAQEYAIFVHERTDVYHHVGTSKFLEKPARYLHGELMRIVAAGLKKGYGVLRSLLLAGLRLQREAQLLTPVDTGALRASAFTRPER